MMDLNNIAEELFSKIRGRFPEVTIGNEQGNVTTEPTEARFFEFPYKGKDADLGKISVSLDEKNGITVMYSTDVVEGETELSKKDWYNFLKELRKFSKKRMLNFNTRNINKSNLEKRDYQYLAKNTFGDEQMNESKLYGTGRVSYQDIDNARLIIKHTENINQESATGRTQKVGAIYIESAEGERFKYPFKHLSGARAMARHVSEGGNAYDDFGKHIVSMSEEMSKLRKFKTYMGRSAVMAESLSEYMDVVKERISTVKKTIESLQKKSFYEDAIANFESPVFEDVPQDIQDSWVDQLTIRQFNEELKDVFPYIYNLVGEANKAKELGPEDLVDEGERHGNDKMYDKCWDGYKKVPGKKRGEKGSCVKEEDDLEELFDQSLGQFAEGSMKDQLIQAMEKIAADDSGELLSDALRGKMGPDIQNYLQDMYDDVAVDNGWHPDDDHDEIEQRMHDHIIDDYGMGEGNAYAHAIRKAKMDGKKKGDKVQGPDGDEITLEKDQKTPLGEFILSYFDRHTGQFPKGETAVLTMVEKDYGEEFIEPAKAFIEQINNLVSEKFGYKEPEQDFEYNRMRELAGLR